MSPSIEIIKDAMVFRRARNEMINSNIANVDTPFYKARDIRFEHYLAQESVSITNKNFEKSKLGLARSNELHMRPMENMKTNTSYMFSRDGHSVRNDGNTVDLDVETTEMAKNVAAYKALSALMKKESGLFKYAIESSSKLA